MVCTSELLRVLPGVILVLMLFPDPVAGMGLEGSWKLLPEHAAGPAGGLGSAEAAGGASVPLQPQSLGTFSGTLNLLL